MSQNETKTNTKKCILGCEKSSALISFPDDWETCQKWFKELLIKDVPASRDEAPPTGLYLCIAHFSAQQLKGNKKIATSTSIPDQNIPGKENHNDEPEPLANKEDVKKSKSSTNIQTDVVVGHFPKTIITSESSKCFLRCKTYERLHRFPRDEPSFKVWLDKLCIDGKDKQFKKCKLKLCNNHFSQTMKTSKFIYPWAVPDQCLPPEYAFLNEFGLDKERETILPSDSPITLPARPTQPECILKCTDYTNLYGFPVNEHRRRLWLRKIGLSYCFLNHKVCNRHFTKRMFKNNELIKTAYPNANLPDPSQFPAPKLKSISKNGPVLVYRQYTTQKKNPKRERAVQTDVIEEEPLKPTNSVGEWADEDFASDDDEKSSLSDSPPAPPQNRKGFYECLKCGEISIDSISNRKHLDLHDKLPALCFYCGRLFSNRLTLKKHETKEHILKTKNLHRCPLMHCKKAFHCVKNFEKHLEKHTQRTKHWCDICGRAFFSTLKMNCHLLICRPRYKKQRVKSCSKGNKNLLV